MENSFKNFESKKEKLPTREEVLEFVGRFVENVKVVDEKSNTEGLYLLYVQTESDSAKEFNQYEYMRKGDFGDGNRAIETAIYINYYQNGLPVGGDKFAVHDEVSGDWKMA